MTHDHDHPESTDHAHGHDHGHGHDHQHTDDDAHARSTWRPHGHGGGHDHDHGPVDPDIAESREGVRVLMISLVILAITAIAQGVVVYLTSSVALLADTIHNVGDALTAVPLAIAFILSRRLPTQRFPYGLGRTEDLAGLMIVLLIGFSGVVAIVISIRRIIDPQEPTHLLAGILAGVLGFLGNEAVALYRIRQGRRMHSAALIADGQHARVDGFTSLGVAVGLILVWLGFELADPLIGLAIGLVIARITWNTARDVGIRLLDGIAEDTIEPIESVVRACSPEDALIGVRGRWVGHVVHVEVQLDPTKLDHDEWEPLRQRLDAELRDARTRARRVALVAAATTHD